MIFEIVDLRFSQSYYCSKFNELEEVQGKIYEVWVQLSWQGQDTDMLGALNNSLP